MKGCCAKRTAAENATQIGSYLLFLVNSDGRANTEEWAVSVLLYDRSGVKNEGEEVRNALWSRKTMEPKADPNYRRVLSVDG